MMSVSLTVQRILPSALGTILILGSLAGCSTVKSTQSNSAEQPNSNQPAANPTENSQQVVRIGYVRWGLLPIARERKVLEETLAKQNIKVEWVGPFPAFAPVLEAVNAGEVDFTSGGDIPGISGLVGGTPVCIIGYQAPIPEAEAILVRSDSSIQNPKDLIGKKVAVNRGGWGEHLLLKVLAKANVPKEKVERVYLSPTDALPAVTQGHIDAWSVWDPNVAIAEAQHNLRPIASGDAASHYGIYMVQRDFLAQKPDVVKAVLDTIVSEAEWAASNRQAAAEAFGKAAQLEPAVVDQLGERRIVEKLLPLNASIVSDLQNRADWMFEQKAVPKQIDLKQSVCPRTANLEKYTAFQP
ncbi:aliphatic sulfonate ABC transporter substrate-binding protein [Leptolyngbya sp. NK1-12]|uniref:Putative aliphatic sulfonates-binding protein n=1 Tax=Leptolyngbya sp. NK1-12 TaxID=2547451 RepID=A0AA96WKW6_9CYAN|nr:aliphatic sulfonate ABC transporter substrate-binding protein [Leptolyngbya sp. NK1-12]WNZ27025.1 aliphatic sulfonate ABC transporter substrate-binding protein [Leptolyngbya sp. NK1-12]